MTYVGQVWDKSSSINGLDADTMRTTLPPNFPDDAEVAMVVDQETWAVVMFQPFEAAMSGFMWMGTQRAQRVADEMAAQYNDNAEPSSLEERVADLEGRLMRVERVAQELVRRIAGIGTAALG